MPVAKSRPNIIFFFPDQQRWDTMGCYGNPMNLTPVLDKLASEGVRFERAYSVQPVCTPARAVMQTGKYATETGCWRNGISLKRDEIKVAGLLKQAGYETAYIGKWHLSPKTIVPKEDRKEFDYWVASNCLECTSEPYKGTLWDGEGNPVNSVNDPEKDGWVESCSDTYVEEYLYDLEADPSERNNLVADPAYAEVRAELAEILKRRMAEAGEKIPEILPVKR